MNIQQQRQGAVTVLKLEGALTSNDAADFKSRMLKAQRESLGRLVLDASAMPLVDSKGLEALVERQGAQALRRKRDAAGGARADRAGGAVRAL